MNEDIERVIARMERDSDDLARDLPLWAADVRRLIEAYREAVTATREAHLTINGMLNPDADPAWTR